MIITCDNCNTSFELEDNLVKDDGSKVRCTNCDHVFMAHPGTDADESDVIELSDLDMELEMEDAPSLDGESQEDEDADLAFSLDTEDESDALDLSDLEKMLEMEQPEEPSVDIDEEESLLFLLSGTMIVIYQILISTPLMDNKVEIFSIDERIILYAPSLILFAAFASKSYCLTNKDRLRNRGRP